MAVDLFNVKVFDVSELTLGKPELKPANGGPELYCIEMAHIVISNRRIMSNI